MPQRASQLFNELGFVFVSIPKTATNSIWDVVLPDPSYKPFQHVHGNVIKHCMDHFFPGSWDIAYRFACVRHPYDLVRSWYQYHTTHEDISAKVKEFYDFSFDEWANVYDFMTHWELGEQKVLNPLWDGSNPLNQWMWVHDQVGNCLVHDIIHQESLEEGLSKVSQRIPLNRSLRKLNVSGDIEEIELTNQTKKKIQEKFRKDFEIFGFSKEGKK